MHILFLSQVLPYPLDAGPKARSYFVLKHLSQQHQVTLLTFVRASDRPNYVAHLQEFCHAVHTVPITRSRVRDLKFLGQSLLTGQPFLIARDHVPEMADLIKNLAGTGQFDAIHADQLWMAQYALLAGGGPTRPKLVLDQHNAVQLIPRRLAQDESNPLKRLFLAREAVALTRYELNVCRRFDHVVWVTAEDRRAVWGHNGAAAPGQPPSTVVPICVDPAAAPVTPTANPWRVTFLGGLHWPPNAQGILWFARQVFPAIRAQHPQAVLTVIGKNPPAGLERPGVEVTGYAPDPAPYLAETAAFIVPLHAGGGMRVKIVDAWNWGLPIVSTTIGAEGIAVAPERNILMADTPETFAAAVNRLLADPELARRLRREGRSAVTTQYNWRVIYPAWDSIYA
jgi:glycosyltransferase involved in cell wall biosynthesis